jgi:acetyltransferase-like isoleucine patch superfamily enzyme
MNLWLLTKNILAQVRAQMASPLLLTRLQTKYPTCRFAAGAVVSGSSKLGNYNTLFRNVIVLDSTIGDHTYAQEHALIISATIGKFCSIAMGANVGMGQHPSHYVSTHPAFYSASQPLGKSYSDRDIFVPFQRTNIGNDVWIGRNAMIKDGITIGTGAIIAAGAVVTKDVPDYAIVAGVPAKVINYRFDEKVRRTLLETRWWDMPEQWLEEHAALFSDPARFVERWREKNSKS